MSCKKENATSSFWMMDTSVPVHFFDFFNGNLSVYKISSVHLSLSIWVGRDDRIS